MRALTISCIQWIVPCLGPWILRAYELYYLYLVLYTSNTFTSGTSRVVLCSHLPEHLPVILVSEVGYPKVTIASMDIEPLSMVRGGREPNTSHGLPFSPSGEVSMAQSTWEQAETDGYHVSLARSGDDMTVARDPAPGPEVRDVSTSPPGLPMRAGPREPRVQFDAGGALPAAEQRSGSTLPSVSSNSAEQFRRDGSILSIGSGRKPVVMPGTYEGTTPLREYLSHFTLVAQVNGWSSEEAALYLGVSLSGPARRLLSGIDLGAPDGLSRLIAALERRFQPRDQEAIFRAQLKSSRQQKGETVSQVSDAIEQLIRQAYPSYQ